MEQKSDLIAGDIVLVAESGWGLCPENVGKYVELLKYEMWSDRWVVKAYNCELINHEPDHAIDAETFGTNPMVLLNINEPRPLSEIPTLDIDKGKHYRYAFRLNLTQEDIESGFVMVNVDPYRISEVYNLGGWREHLVKKAIRGTEKGHTEDELLEELQCTLDRAKQMLEESRE